MLNAVPLRKPHGLAVALVLGLLCVTARPAVADERDNVVNLAVEVVRPLPNDTLRAVLFIEDNDASPQRLADRVNTQINAALATARDYKSVKVATGTTMTWPVYNDKNRLTGWRTRVSVVLQSQDFPAAQKLVGELQNRLQVESINFSVSDAARTRQENLLIGEALAAFRQRADLVLQGLGGKGWKIVNVNLSTSGGGPQPPVMMVRSKALMADAVATPDMAAGESELRLQVNGSIQITP